MLNEKWNSLEDLTALFLHQKNWRNHWGKYFCPQGWTLKNAWEVKSRGKLAVVIHVLRHYWGKFNKKLTQFNKIKQLNPETCTTSQLFGPSSTHTERDSRWWKWLGMFSSKLVGLVVKKVLWIVEFISMETINLLTNLLLFAIWSDNNLPKP